MPASTSVRASRIPRGPCGPRAERSSSRRSTGEEKLKSYETEVNGVLRPVRFGTYPPPRTTEIDVDPAVPV